MYVCAFGLQSEAHRVRRVGKEEASFSLSLSLHPSRTSIRPSVRPSASVPLPRLPLSLSETQKKRLSLCSLSSAPLSLSVCHNILSG